MLTWAGRAWRMWRAKTHLMAPFQSIGSHCFYDYRLRFTDLPSGLPGVDAPELRPYEGLAAIWDVYTNRFQPDYSTFLDALATRGDSPIQSVLDLGCGTGVLAVRLAATGRQVVGVDPSLAMLAKAQVRASGLLGVQLIEGDFRNIRLGRTFDAIVCGFNSLNYLSEVSQLREVFRVAAEHLRPGGVFVFDTMTEQGMRMVSGTYLHVQLDEARFVLRFAYDAVRRQQKGETLLPTGIEVHLRVPIDPADVVRESRGTGMQVYDYFSSAILPGWVRTGACCFFVMTRQA